MAKIVHSEAAPAESVHYTFAALPEGFDLGGKSKGFETNDTALLAEAESHPWLKVERDPEEVIGGAYVQQLDPKDDPLSAANDVSRDPEAIKRDEDAKAEAWFGSPTAIDAGLDQEKVVTTGRVAETLAADAKASNDDSKKDSK